jgi:DNA-binding NarL/FixJ family response regulator
VGSRVQKKETLMKTARILVADANSSFLLGAMASLSQLPQVEIVGCNAAAAEAIEQAEALVADVLVLDADTLGAAGWLALRRLLARPKRPRVVVTSQDLDGENCFLARVAGADVCLRKDQLRHKLFPLAGAIPPVMQEEAFHVHPAL